MARMTHFSSDSHFGHQNIIRYTGRPWTNTTEMDADLILRWNQTVDHNDYIYHLGDFCLGDKDEARHYFRQLNGIIRILGNHTHHDKHWLKGYGFGKSDYTSRSGHRVEILPPIVTLDFDQREDKYPIRLVLCHFPLNVWEDSRHNSRHLHGHTHSNLKNRGRVIDVGVDAHDYTPVTIDQIMELTWESPDILSSRVPRSSGSILSTTTQ